MSETLEDMAVTLGKCQEFIEADFRLRTEVGSVMSPPRRAAAASWTIFYQYIINIPSQIVQRLLHLVRQCDAVDAKLLKTNKIHLARQVNSLKQEFDLAFEKLLDHLNSLTNDIFMKALGDNPKKAEKR